MRWTECRLVAIDTETTGLDPYNLTEPDRIMEVAAVELVLDAQLRVTGTRPTHWLINPERPIPRKATQVTGITDEDVSDKPPFAARAHELRRLLADAIVVAHNLPFDLGFLRTELERAGSAWPATRAEIDTLTLSQRRMSDLKIHKLGEVARALGVPLDNAHRATDDAEACGRVLVEMARRFEAPGELDGFVDWCDAVSPPPDTGHLGIGRRGVAEFLDGPYKGESVEAHPDYLQWMTMAMERRGDAWQARFPESVQRWARRWLRARGAGRMRQSPRGQSSADWNIDPAAWRA